MSVPMCSTWKKVISAILVWMTIFFRERIETIVWTWIIFRRIQMYSFRRSPNMYLHLSVRIKPMHKNANVLHLHAHAELMWAFLTGTCFLCVSPGTESIMDATSALYHATPSKAKIQLFKILFLLLITSPFKQEMTHKQFCQKYVHMCVCSKSVFCFLHYCGQNFCYLVQTCRVRFAYSGKSSWRIV